jgi:hypothetical protein
MVFHHRQDFPAKIMGQLESYSPRLFTFLADPAHPHTTRALNT